jgi:hypothetical protein
MGNKFYGLCNGQETKVGENHNEWEVSKDEEKINYSQNPKADQSAKLIQKNFQKFKAQKELSEEEQSQMKEFDENIVSHGRFITLEDLNARIDDSVKKVERVLKPFYASEEERNKFKHVFNRGPFLFHDLTVYYGQWSFLGKKQGYGIFVKPDGSKYEGFWYNDRIDGKGRYIDINGNYYEGNFFFKIFYKKKIPF